MHLQLRERDGLTRRWTTWVDTRIEPGEPLRHEPITLNEADEIELALTFDDGGTPLRILVGDVLIASTEETDRTDFRIYMGDDGDRDRAVCRGRLLRDWVGITELQLQARHDDIWQPIFTITPLRIAAGKIAQQEFEVLCEEVASHSAAALLDVYGKTFVGLELEYRRGEHAPVAALLRIRQAIDQLSTALREIAAQPAYRLRTRRVREPAIAVQGVSDLTLEEACFDPSLIIRHPDGLMFREHVREIAVPHFNLAENRILSGFIDFLLRQLTDLEQRLLSEIAEREDRKAIQDRPGPDGKKSWWETEDLPRIVEMRKLLDNLRAMRLELHRLARYPFLPRGAELREIPQSTPLLRSNRAYSTAYRTVLSHFKSFRVRLGEEHLLTRGKSLPVLYEWWCVLDLIRILQSCLMQCDDQKRGVGSPFRRLELERTRFVVDFLPDQAIDYEDDAGRLVRLRYVPAYRPEQTSGGLAYGLLSPELQRTPDVALELFPPGDDGDGVPELIIVFDAKYSLVPQMQKLEEVRMKYGKIGTFENGKVLSRQIWALVPSLPARPRIVGPEWSATCTIDNSGFWSEGYDMASATAGVIQAKPRLGEGRPPLEGLVRLLLRRAGLNVRL